MRRLLPIAAVALAGCSTAPVTNLMDKLSPSYPNGPGRSPEPAEPPPPPRRPRTDPPGGVGLGEPIPTPARPTGGGL